MGSGVLTGLTRLRRSVVVPSLVLRAAEDGLIGMPTIYVQEVTEPVLFTQVHAENFDSKPMSGSPSHPRFHHEQWVFSIWEIKENRKLHPRRNQGVAANS